MAEMTAAGRRVRLPRNTRRGAEAFLVGRWRPALPDVPTVGETLAGFDVTTWRGIGVPQGTPAEIIERLNRDINAGLADPAVKARLAEVGATPIVMTPGAFGAMMTDDTARWAKIIRLSGVKPE